LITLSEKNKGSPKKMWGASTEGKRFQIGKRPKKGTANMRRRRATEKKRAPKPTGGGQENKP